MASHQFLFYVPDLERSTGSISVEDEEHHHIRNVLRLGAGERVHLGNGRGLIVSATLKDVTRHHSIAEIVEVVSEEPDPPRVVLAMALLSKDRFAGAVEQCAVRSADARPVDVVAASAIKPHHEIVRPV